MLSTRLDATAAADYDDDGKRTDLKRYIYIYIYIYNFDFGFVIINLPFIIKTCSDTIKSSCF